MRTVRVALTYSRLWVALVSHVQPSQNAVERARCIASPPREVSRSTIIRSGEINGLQVRDHTAKVY